jgi:hypothetical protein
MPTNPAFLQTLSETLTAQTLYLGLIPQGNEVSDATFESNPLSVLGGEQSFMNRPSAVLPVGAYNATTDGWELPATAQFQFSPTAAITVAQCFVVRNGIAQPEDSTGTIVLLHTFPSPIVIAENQTVVLKTPWRWE